MLRLAGISLTLPHPAIIDFHLFGWIWLRARRVHLLLVLATAFCWLVPGIWFGIGYCPVPDWQGKAQLGEQNLPSSFIIGDLGKLTRHLFAEDC